MKKNKLFLFIVVISLLNVYSCSNNKNSNPTSPNTNPTNFNAQQLFSDTWTGELSAIAYDSTTNNLFYIRSDNSVPNEIRRYNFVTDQTSIVYTYQSQWDYGMRVLNGDLYIVRSYDNSILRLTNLNSNTLTDVGTYPDNNGSNLLLREIDDVTLLNDNLYFVCGNMLTSMQNNGIQYLQGPDFTTVHELLSSNNADWPDSSYGYYRSLLSIGSGVSAKFVITTGPNGSIELRDASGNLLTSEPGYGDSYLQKDSQSRIYAITGSNVNTKITRWSSNLDNKEEFTINFPEYNGGDGIRFILKDAGNNIDVVMVQFRKSNPVFYKTTIPN